MLQQIHKRKKQIVLEVEEDFGTKPKKKKKGLLKIKQESQEEEEYYQDEQNHYLVSAHGSISQAGGSSGNGAEPAGSGTAPTRPRPSAAPTAPTATTAATADTLLERGVKPTPSNVAIELNHPEIGTNELAGIPRWQRAKFGKKTRCAVDSVRTWLQGCGTPAWLHSTM